MATQSFPLDQLYCEEENFIEEETNPEHNICNYIHQYDDEEIIDALLSKERAQAICMDENWGDENGRKEVVEWMMMVNTHFGFSKLTSVLSVNYLDRLLSRFGLDEDKPWMLHLAAVTCLSLAAKVEETFVPLLLHLQIEGTKYIFEAKNIQKMELLVLSTLEWKMHPVTPLSFVDYMIRRLGFKHHVHWEFMRRCECLLLSFLPEWRFVECLPSVLAAATMMHVIDHIQPCNALDYHNHLMGVLKISKEKVNHCYQLIKELSSSSTRFDYNQNNGDVSAKRKHDQINESNSTNNYSWQIGGSSSPSGVIDASYIYLDGYDSSNDSWVATTATAAAADTGTITTTSDHIINNNDHALSLPLSSSSSSSPWSSRKKGRMMREHQPSSVFLFEYIGTP